MKFILFNTLFLIIFSQTSHAHIKWHAEQKTIVDGQRNVLVKVWSDEQGKLKLSKSEYTLLDPLHKKLTINKLSGLSSEPQTIGPDQFQEWNLVLSPGYIQIPVEFDRGEGYEAYLIGFHVNLNNTEVKTIVIESREAKLWFGLGGTFLSYNQESSINQGAIKFKDTRIPALSFRGELGLADEYTFFSYLNVAPGKMESSSSLSFTEDDYFWIVYGVEGIHVPQYFKFGSLQFSYRAGLQMLQVPFVIRTTTANVGAAEANSITNISLGPMISYEYSKKWNIEAFARLLYPISWGSLFGITPEVRFDFNTSVSWTPNADSPWVYSLQWFGQSIKYDYTHTDLLLQSSVSGELDLFNTGLDLSIGYTF